MMNSRINFTHARTKLTMSFAKSSVQEAINHGILLEDLSGLKVYSFKIPVSVTEYTFNPEAHINPSPGSISVRGSSNIT